MKEVIKQARNPVKNRIIPPEIVEKYHKKLESFADDITRILDEEKHERELAKLENQANRVENLLKGSDNQQRTWFQTKKERKDEKGCQQIIINYSQKFLYPFFNFFFNYFFFKPAINNLQLTKSKKFFIEINFKL